MDQLPNRSYESDEPLHPYVPDTSRAAYESYSDKNVDRVYRSIEKNPGSNYTDIVDDTRLPVSSVSSALSELSQAGKIKNVGLKKTCNGKLGRTWEVDEEGSPARTRSFQVTVPQWVWTDLNYLSAQINSENGTEAAQNGDELGLEDLYSAQKLAAEYIIQTIRQYRKNEAA